jgi:osmotically-inducible protein OsmY
VATAGDIQARVHEALKADPMIDSDDIVVEFFGDYVVLNGTVPSQAQSAEATAAAEHVEGVESVRNLLAIALPGDDYGDDDELVLLARQALAASLDAPGGVAVTVHDGIVYLEGTVPTSADRATAEDCVASCAGVLSVNNDIEVQGEAPQH